MLLICEFFVAPTSALILSILLRADGVCLPRMANIFRHAQDIGVDAIFFMGAIIGKASYLKAKRSLGAARDAWSLWHVIMRHRSSRSGNTPITFGYMASDAHGRPMASRRAAASAAKVRPLRVADTSMSILVLTRSRPASTFSRHIMGAATSHAADGNRQAAVS